MKNDIKIYVSATTKEPTDQNFQKMFHNPGRMVTFKSQGSEVFEVEWVYVSFYSMFGCSLSVQVSFPEEVKTRKGKVNVEEG
mmetsp:Transcript_5663/g.4310  ORF Transcript_5663/g.4310 Transcript_5663/m.4310 type:complete len:82 (+) Transcript_5663:985-1230(+)